MNCDVYVQVISTVKKVQLAAIPPPAAADLQEAGTSAVAASNYYAQQHEDDSDEDQCDFDRDNLDDLAWGHQCDCHQCSAKRRKQPKSKKSRRGGGWRGGWKRRNDCSLMWPWHLRIISKILNSSISYNRFAFVPDYYIVVSYIIVTS